MGVGPGGFWCCCDRVTCCAIDCCMRLCESLLTCKSSVEEFRLDTRSEYILEITQSLCVAMFSHCSRIWCCLCFGATFIPHRGHGIGRVLL